MFERNVGGWDRRLRAVVAVVATVGGVWLLATGETVGAAVGLAVAAGLGFNALSGRCLGNRLLGIDTCSR